MGCKEPDAKIILCSIGRYIGGNERARTLEEILETEKPEIAEAAKVKAERILKEIECADKHDEDQEDA